MSVFPGRWLVHGSGGKDEKTKNTDTTDKEEISPILYSTVSLSFWGGIDPETGIIIDQLHPLHGKCVTDTILCIPSGRGSCTASQVLLELIFNQKAPKAIVLRDCDGLLCVGALIAQSMMNPSSYSSSSSSSQPLSSSSSNIEVLDIIQLVGNEHFHNFISTAPQFGQIQTELGCIIIGKTKQEVQQKGIEAVNDHHKKKKKTTTITMKKKKQDATVSSSDDHHPILSSIQLNQEEKDMLSNAQTEAERRAVQCLIRFAHITFQEEENDEETTKSSSKRTYINVEKGHIDGCTYIGPGGLQFVKTLLQEGGKVKIPTTLNSVSTDLINWKQLGIIPTQSQQSSIELAKCYIELGCNEQSLTCAPYLLPNPPTLGQHIVWGESNAVVYANSMLGARTEKYADYMDICCSIVGKVPYVGVHLDQHRQPTIVIDIRQVVFFDTNTSTNKTNSNKKKKNNNNDTFDLIFPVLGHLCGTLSDGRVPLVIGLEQYSDNITNDHMKAFCAAFGTTGTSPLVHVAGITAEAKDIQQVEQMMKQQTCQTTTCIVTVEQLNETFAILDQQQQQQQQQQYDGDTDTERIDQISLGNPHLSLTECDQLLDYIQELPEENRTKHESVQLIACMSRVLYNQSPAIPALRKFGMEFVQDTCWCMLLAPPMIPTHTTATVTTMEDEHTNGTVTTTTPTTASTILTNSGKYAHYGPGLTGHKFRLGSTKDCIQAAVSGTLPRRRLGGGGDATMPWKAISSSQTRSWSNTTSSGIVIQPQRRRFSRYATAISNNHEETLTTTTTPVYDQWYRHRQQRVRQSRTLGKVLSRLRW